jgi:hypothetical protein
MEQLLLQLGLGITSNAVYDFLKDFFTKNSKADRLQLQNRLVSFLNVQNANIIADKIITFLAQNGDIRIEGTSIYANDSISMFSSQNTRFTFGNNSSSTTKNTKIDVGKDALIKGQGGAGIKQNEDGSISFLT